MPAAGEPVPDVMVLGVGNLLLGDDGTGVHVVRRLSGQDWECDAQLVDGGTLGLDLLPELEGVRRLVLVDAVHHGAAPGHVGTWRGTEVARAFAHPMSVHEVGVESLLGALALSGRTPPEVWLVGVEPESLEPGTQLSAPVAAALDELTARVLALALEPEGVPA